MARKIISTKTKFNAGELAPSLYSRVDNVKYEAGLRTAENVFAKIHGPVHRRNGSQFIREVKTSSDNTYLIPYQFSNTEYYILEFGDQYIRFYTDGGILGAPYEVTTPYTSAQVKDLSYVQSGRSIYLCHSSHAPRKLTRKGDTDWTLETINFAPPPTYEAGHTFASATLTPGATTGTSVTFTASTGVFLAGDEGRQIINNASGETGRAIITGYTSTTQVTADIVEDFTDTNPIAGGDWQLDLSPICDLTPDTLFLGSLCNITSDATDSTSSIAAFRSDDVGKYIYLNGGVVKILELVSSSSINCEVLAVLDSTDETGIWTLEEDTWDSTRGYPGAVGLYRERLVFGGSTAQPNTLWFSEVDIFTGFNTGADDDDAIQMTISSRSANQISWLANARDLVVGTTGSEGTIDEGGSTAFTPASRRYTARTFLGSNYQNPIQITNEIIFIQGSQLKLRSFRYDFNIDGYDSEDITILAEHITENKVSRLAYAQEPNRIIYAVLENGDMLAGTYQRSQEVLGWCKYTTDGEFEDVQVVTNGSKDEVWVVVKRTINGATKRYVELFDDGEGEANLDGFSDSYLTYSDPKTITGVTQANPGVVTTSAAHSFSDGDRVKILNVVGMTELNQNKYIVAGATSTTFKLESTAARTSLVSSSFQWTASGSGTDEYYCEAAGGGAPALPTGIISMYEDDTAMTGGTAGSLAAGEWDFADNDSLGFSTVYVRLNSTIADPDGNGQGWVEAALGVDTSAYTAYSSGGEVHKLVTTISGLSHLEAKTVQLRVDGAVASSKTVSSGSITLDAEAYEVVAGLSYESKVTLLPKSFDVGLGEMQGQDNRWIKPILRVYKSYIPALNGITKPSRKPSDLLDQPVGLFSGDLEYGAGTFKEGTELSITLSDPGPLRLGGLFGTLAGGVK